MSETAENGAREIRFVHSYCSSPQSAMYMTCLYGHMDPHAGMPACSESGCAAGVTARLRVRYIMRKVSSRSLINEWSVISDGE